MNKISHSLSLCIPKAQGEFLKQALGPETDDMKRCRVHWQERGEEVCLIIEAEDIHSLRAALNSYVRWSDIALGVLKISSHYES
jgi:tRNA threonylcarbamoyladenosine modification (KEOPS) complex  Pcc1 subunit